MAAASVVTRVVKFPCRFESYLWCVKVMKMTLQKSLENGVSLLKNEESESLVFVTIGNSRIAFHRPFGKRFGMPFGWHKHE